VSALANKAKATDKHAHLCKLWVECNSDFVGDAGREGGTHCTFEGMRDLNFAESFACWVDVVSHCWCWESEVNVCLIDARHVWLQRGRAYLVFVL